MSPQYHFFKNDSYVYEALSLSPIAYVYKGLLYEKTGDTGDKILKARIDKQSSVPGYAVKRGNKLKELGTFC